MLHELSFTNTSEGLVDSYILYPSINKRICAFRRSAQLDDQYGFRGKAIEQSSGWGQTGFYKRSSPRKVEIGRCSGCYPPFPCQGFASDTTTVLKLGRGIVYLAGRGIAPDGMRLHARCRLTTVRLNNSGVAEASRVKIFKDSHSVYEKSECQKPENQSRLAPRFTSCSP